MTDERELMSSAPARAALRQALMDWRRHAIALAVVGGAVSIATVLGSSEAYFAAGLVTFAVWMVWFVLTAVEWVRLADF